MPSSSDVSTLPVGPEFIDTASCRCALEYTPQEAWQCTGDSSTDLSTTNDGKWYLASNTSDVTSTNQTDIWGGADNPPDLSNTYIIPNGTDSLSPLNSTNEDQLSPQNQACTGQNDTQASALFYADVKNATDGQPVQGSCYLSGAVPLQIQNATSWNTTGCLKGFYCPNNTITELPEYCPPLAVCQEARLEGATCFPSMGILEPAPCKPGHYCPHPGNDTLECPAGSYCPLGSYAPLDCDIFSKCPAMSVRNLTARPLAILILVDLLLAVVWLAIKLSRYYRGRGKKSVSDESDNSFVKRTATVIERARSRRYGKNQTHNVPAQYAELEDEEMEMEPTIRTVARVPTGFDVAMQDAWRYSTMLKGAPVTENQRDLQSFVQSLSKCLGANKFGLSFEFQDLMFQPLQNRRSLFCRRYLGKSIVAHYGALWVHRERENATTFVNVLMGKQTATGGITMVNGVAGKIEKYKKLIGYVPQDDIVSPELTVRENILHSARIRLPCTWKDAEIQKHVDVLISCLQLSHVADSLVGSTAAPVISGGQRKRVSIGMELAAAPMAIFLDEPTSGLDATSASSIMTTLKAISRLGITIVTIIHQPRKEIFESLDSLVLLGQGRMLYQGKQDNVKPYFEELGFKFPEHDNPADVVGDIIAGQGALYKDRGDASVKLLIYMWKKRFQEPMGADEVKAPTVPIQEILALQAMIKLRGAPWYRQIYHCFNRSLLQQYRLKGSFIAEIGVGVLAGGLIGLSELKQKGTNFRGIFIDPYEMISSAIDYSSVPEMALLCGLAIGLTASAPGVKIFGSEKLLYKREAAAGHNGFAYYVGKVASTLPRMLLAALHFTVLLVTLATPRISFGASYAANALYFYCIYGLASCVSMVVRREDGPLIATMASLVVGVLNGMSPSLHNVTRWHMAWLWRACPGTWLAETYFDANVTPWSHLYQIDHAASQVGYKLGVFNVDLLVLLGIGCAYRVIAFAALRYSK